MNGNVRGREKGKGASEREKRNKVRGEREAKPSVCGNRLEIA